ncbi:MAG: helix-turn-helix domain-containing protein [Lachnospiraceae bacterium]|nr:helix-turn-helix domain-containing protein [Lachnospiraceae bacterium]MBR4060934.1 helix-turn-helix domain-containing protein [Lachnospiraceae bacterium]
MTHRIISVTPLDNMILSVVFQNGIEKVYDVRSLYDVFPQFQVLEKVKHLFEEVQVDVGGYGISWNDELDLDANTIWEEGTESGVRQEMNVLNLLADSLIRCRERAGITQKQLSEIVGIYQADISKIERGLTNPSVSTLKRLADGLGVELRIEFIQKKC